MFWVNIQFKIDVIIIKTVKIMFTNNQFNDYIDKFSNEFDQDLFIYLFILDLKQEKYIFIF